MPRFRARQKGMGIGEVCSIGSALAWSGGVIIYKRLGETLAPLQLNLLKNLIVLSFGFLSERLTALQGVGFVLVSAGVLLATHQRAEKHLTPVQLRRGLLY